jgi:hypothetical protein
MIELLHWVSEQPRMYAETVDRWKSSCPRLMYWEDAIADGLVRVRDGHVELTETGKERLESAQAKPRSGLAIAPAVGTRARTTSP